MKVRINIDIRVGRVVKYFVLSDLVLLSGWGLIEPLLSIYIVQYIAGATLVTVGISAAIYWILKSLIQLPLANFLDRTDGETDDFHALIAGLLLASFSAMLFGFVREAWQLYLVQALHACAFALYAASWPAIFSRHLDKNKVSFDWALDSTGVSIASGVSGFLGAVIASQFGFPAVFIGAGVLSLVAAVVLLMAPELLMPRKTSAGSMMAKESSRPSSKL